VPSITSSAERSAITGFLPTRAARAAVRPAHAAYAAIVYSCNRPPVCTGGTPGRPWLLTHAPIAITVRPVAGAPTYGPCWPNGLMRTTARRGFAVPKDDGVRPSVSSPCAPSDSIRRSVPLMSDRRVVRSSASVGSRSTERLSVLR
jgi:hypothetical protein